MKLKLKCFNELFGTPWFSNIKKKKHYVLRIRYAISCALQKKWKNKRITLYVPRQPTTDIYIYTKCVLRDTPGSICMLHKEQLNLTLSTKTFTAGIFSPCKDNFYRIFNMFRQVRNFYLGLIESQNAPDGQFPKGLKV